MIIFFKEAVLRTVESNNCQTHKRKQGWFGQSQQGNVVSGREPLRVPVFVKLDARDGNVLDGWQAAVRGLTVRVVANHILAEHNVAEIYQNLKLFSSADLVKRNFWIYEYDVICYLQIRKIMKQARIRNEETHSIGSAFEWQWAAVTTQNLLMRVPPQTQQVSLLTLYPTKTTKGNSPGFAISPPMMFSFV